MSSGFQEENALLGGLRRNPVQKRSLQKVEAVLLAAETRVVKYGYKETASDPDALIAAAKITTGSFYTYFANCEAVLEILRLKYLAQATELAETVLSSKYTAWQDGILALNHSYVVFYRRPAVKELLLSSALPPSALEKEREVDQFVAARLRDMLEKHEPAFARVEQVHFDVAEEIGGSVLRMAFRVHPLGDETIIKEIDRATLAYLSALIDPAPSA